jgi:alpha-ketoglutarate-dependent taurine dioxygenase
MLNFDLLFERAFGPGLWTQTQILDLLQATAPTYLKELLANYGHDPERPGILVLNGVMESDPTLVTPADDEAVPPSDQMMWHLAVARQLGWVYGHEAVQNGNVVHNLKPSPKAVGTQSGLSNSNFDLHIDIGFDPESRPDFIVNTCLRDQADAHTPFADVRDIVTYLSQEAIDVARQRLFEIGVDHINVAPPNSPDSAHPYRTALLRGNPDQITFYSEPGRIRGLTPEAKRALIEFRQAVPKATQTHHLTAGSVMVIDNNRVVHGRTAFPATYDGTDRWLLRTWVARDRGRLRLSHYNAHRVVGRVRASRGQHRDRTVFYGPAHQPNAA